jgi:hypothetical protein
VTHRRAAGALPTAGLLAALTALAGCSAPVTVTPAPDAADPVCARAVGALPDRVAGLEARETSAQAALAWGEPAVVLRCGVTPLGPTEEVCLSVQGADGVEVDWVVVQGERGSTFTTYGRVPALEVTVPAALVEQDPALPTAVLTDVAPAATALEQERRCVASAP